MSEWISTPRFEENVRQSFAVPKIRSEFVAQVYGDLMQQAGAKSRKPRLLSGLRPAAAVALAILALMIIGTLVIGPQRVYAEVLQLFGYIPGVGIVDQSSPIRMLAEPVNLTRDGITVSVNQAVLTATETRLEFGVSGVPLSAYPKGEAVSGCIEFEYMRLPDGTRMEASTPIPAAVNDVTFVLPCIFDTLPGTTPTNWELPLRFIAAPPDLTILPVIDVTPLVSPTGTNPGPDSETSAVPTNESAQAAVSVDQIIETEDGYILLGFVRPDIPEGSWLQVTGAATIRDAEGKKVSYSFPNDVQPLDDSGFQGGLGWAMKIKGTGVKFPLTIRFSGVIISQVDPQASAEISIDVGNNPQPQQVWEVNQDVQLAGSTIRLVSVTSSRSDGYSFRIDPGSDLTDLSVQIEGHQAIAGGGGGPLNQAFTKSLVYSELPKGELTILFSNPRSASPAETWQVEWQPETLRDFTSSVSATNICWNADTIQTVPLVPTGLDGKVVLTQLNPQRQIVLAGLDGSQKQIIAADSTRAALSQDGTRLAYSTAEGIQILDLTSGEGAVIAGVIGRDLHWSADGSRIAYMNSGDLYGVFVIDSDGKNPQQLSNLGYESIAGWSPDGSTLYYAIPGSSGDGFLLRSVNVGSGDTQDLFVLKDSSRKEPMPAVSPSGKWIAYRASDNSSLYMMGMDGSEVRLLLDNPATAINGIAWEREGNLLGVSLITPQTQDGEIILIAADSCETYRLPGLSGKLVGIFIP